MSHPLIQRLGDAFGVPTLDEAGFDAYVGACEYSVLFFTEDPRRFPESLDVAVVLPELLKAFPPLAAALIEPGLERTLQARYGFTAWPSLVFLRRGHYLGCLSRILNWNDYLREIPRILAGEAREDALRIPLVTLPADAGGH